MNFKPAGVALLAVTLIAADKASDVNLAEESRRWWSHVEKLASDELKGRDVGSDGFETAARYVASEFEKIGLKPGASSTSYRQKVGFIQRRIDESQSGLALIRDG